MSTYFTACSFEDQSAKAAAPAISCLQTSRRRFERPRTSSAFGYGAWHHAVVVMIPLRYYGWRNWKKQLLSLWHRSLADCRGSSCSEAAARCDQLPDDPRRVQSLGTHSGPYYLGCSSCSRGNCPARALECWLETRSRDPVRLWYLIAKPSVASGCSKKSNSSRPCLKLAVEVALLNLISWQMYADFRSSWEPLVPADSWIWACALSFRRECWSSWRSELSLWLPWLLCRS